MQLTDLKAIIGETGLFALLGDAELERLVGAFTLVHFSLGQTVCRAGDEADAFYIVYSGRARVVGQTAQGEELTVGILTRGNHFGEQGLLTDSRRHYTIRAAGDLALLRLGKAEFDALLKEQPQLGDYLRSYISDTSVRNFLKLCTVFSPLSPKEIQDLLSAVKECQFEPGEVIIREGDPGDAFYVLRTGSADVLKESAGPKPIAHLQPGASFGELALLTGQPRAASIVAREACTVLRLEKADFDRILASAPKLKDAIAAAAAGYGQTLPPDEEAAPEPVAALPPPSEPAPTAAPAEEQSNYRPRRARRYPVLLQVSETDCGAASLAMVLRYYRKYVSINRVRDLANVGREGATLYDVAQAAETLGLRARGVRVSYEHLARVELPAIAHWEGYHYIVLYEVHPDHVVVADPAIGLRRMTREEFTQGWTGYLLVLTPTPALEQVEPSRTTLGRFLPLLRPHRRLLLEILFASLLIQLFGLAAPIFTQVIVDKVLVHRSVSMLNIMLVGMVVIAFFQTAATALREYLMVHTTRRIDLEMVVAFYRHVLSLPMRYFEERRVGDILKRFGENAKIREMLTGRALGAVLDCLMVVVYLGLMLYYNTKLALVAIAFIPAYAILTLVATPIMKRQYRESFERSAAAESQMVEAVAGIGTVKATAAEQSVRWAWEGLMVKALNVQFRGALINMASFSAGTTLQTLNTTFLLWYGAHLVIAGELSVGQLMAFNALVGNVTRPILGLIGLWDSFQEVSVALERLNDVFDAKPEEDGHSEALMRLPTLRGHLRFENVTFRYPTRPDRNALQNINLEVYPGQTVALVGRSGAGKSTFANLLLRLHEPTAGRIYVDGYDLRQVSLASLRAQIGVVPQDVVLFSGTIRENIAFGKPDAPLEEVVGAAMLAGAHEFISELPLGYETKIGERGQSLSGGQKQRIAIARALFHKPRILIFDEATSALDTESERAIQQNLEHILKDRTTIIIAHRLSTVRNADLIVVMDQGNIVESGTHYSLMEQRGLYYYLNSQQLEG